MATNNNVKIPSNDAMLELVYGIPIVGVKHAFGSAGSWVYDEFVRFRNKVASRLFAHDLASILVRKFSTLNKDYLIYEACVYAAIRDNETAMLKATREHSPSTYADASYRDLKRYINKWGYGKGQKARMLGNRTGTDTNFYESDAVKFRGWAFCQITGRTNSVNVAKRLKYLVPQTMTSVVGSDAYKILMHLANGDEVSSTQMDRVADNLTICEYASLAFYCQALGLGTTASLTDFWDALVAKEQDTNKTKRSLLISLTGYPSQPVQNVPSGSMIECKAIELFKIVWPVVMGVPTLSVAAQALVASKIKGIQESALYSPKLVPPAAATVQVAELSDESIQHQIAEANHQLPPVDTTSSGVKTRIKLPSKKRNALR